MARSENSTIGTDLQHDRHGFAARSGNCAARLERTFNAIGRESVARIQDPNIAIVHAIDSRDSQRHSFPLHPPLIRCTIVFMIIEFETLRHRDRYAWMIASIVPRPIAFVSTISSDGIVNLAPFSYFNGVSASPPIVSIAIGSKRGGVLKDTLRNIESTNELVVNIVTESMAEAMVKCSGEWPSDVNEFDISGLTPLPSIRVRPPRVAESPLSMECRLVQIVRVGEPSTAIVLAEVQLMHADESVLTNGLPDPEKLRPLARLGGDLYASLGEFRSIPRPVIG